MRLSLAHDWPALAVANGAAVAPHGELAGMGLAGLPNAPPAAVSMGLAGLPNAPPAAVS